MAKVLSKPQAAVIYTAIYGLNKFGGKFDTIVFDNRINFVCYAYDAGYGVTKDGKTVEHFDTLRFFADYYGLE